VLKLKQGSVQNVMSSDPVWVAEPKMITPPAMLKICYTRGKASIVEEDNIDRGRLGLFGDESVQKFAHTPYVIMHYPVAPLDLDKVKRFCGVPSSYARVLGHPDTIQAAFDATICPRPTGVEMEVAKRALDILCADEIVDTSARNSMNTIPLSIIRNSLCRRSALTLAEALPDSFEPAESRSAFTLDAAHLLASAMGAREHLHATEDAVRNLNMYVGGYLHELDLSQSYITGSAVMSSALRPAIYEEFANHRTFIDHYYPSMVAHMDPTLKLTETSYAYLEVFEGRSTDFSADVIFGEEKPATLKQRVGDVRRTDHGTWETRRLAWSRQGARGEYNCPMLVGSDIDIAIHCEAEEFKDIVDGHFGVIKRHFPTVFLRRVNSSKYEILASAYSPKFRKIDLYRASWGVIQTHHLGMVRLAYTANHGSVGFEGGSGEARFYLTPTCLKSAINRTTPNFYQIYNGSKYSDVIEKYAVRGFPPKNLPLESSAGYLHRMLQRLPTQNRPVFASAVSSMDKRELDAAWDTFVASPPAIRSLSGGYSITSLVSGAASKRPWGFSTPFHTYSIRTRKAIHVVLLTACRFG
jgi:hypothetical protein